MQPAPTPPALIVTAVPEYRLLIYPDLPTASRFFIVRTRVQPISDDLFHFTPTDVRVTLSDGSTGRTFDRARAKALLDALDLVEAQSPPGPAPNGYGWDGRLAPAIQDRLRTEIGLALLDEGAFTRTEPLQGYLVVDTGRLQSSLSDASLEVTVSRVGDDLIAKESYQFGERTNASENAAAAPVADP